MEDVIKVNLIIGYNGIIGKNLSNSFRQDQNIHIEKSIYSDWIRGDGVLKISRYFKKWSNTQSTIYIAAGITNPNDCKQLHKKINFELPTNIIKGTEDLNYRVVCFGTVMDEFLNDRTTNFYLLSKKMLTNFVHDYPNSDQLLYIKMHTIFGHGYPKKYMFLGHIYNSIKNGKKFVMTNGNQLREYHHINDVILSINKLIDMNIRGTVTINHGNPIMLKDMAKKIFIRFGCMNLLSLGTMTDPEDDNYKRKYVRTPILRDIEFRDTIPALEEYLDSIL